MVSHFTSTTRWIVNRNTNVQSVDGHRRNYHWQLITGTGWQEEKLSPTKKESTGSQKYRSLCQRILKLERRIKLEERQLRPRSFICLE